MIRSRRISIGLLALGAVLFTAGLFSGPASLSLKEQWSALLSGDGVAGTILWDLRLPRLCMAVLAGSALGLAGLLMQTYFKNPLAGPSVLGVTSGSTLGVALVSLGGMAIGTGLGVTGTVVGALLGAWAVMVLLGAVIGWFRSRSALLIFGLMIGYLTGALVTILQAGAEAGALQAFVVWGMGSFGHADWAGDGILALTLMAAGGWVFRHRDDLDMWLLGSLTARSMGVNERGLTWGILTITGALAALVTAWCGPVAFLGLATPHLVRILYRQHGAGQLLVPVMLTGSVLALMADWAVRFTAVPLNAVLSMVGAPVVLWLLMRRTHSPAR
ncbi:MAG: FecCD family ABC transporter permease [Flavobacteriales bacterium]